MSDFMDPQLLREFTLDSLDHLETIEADLQSLESLGADADEILVNRIFRAAHSIKGAAGFFGLDNILQLAHKTENLLDRIRGNEVVPDPGIVSTLFLAFDGLRDMVEDPETSDQKDIAEELSQLEAISPSKPKLDLSDIPPPSAPPAPEPTPAPVKRPEAKQPPKPAPAPAAKAAPEPASLDQEVDLRGTENPLGAPPMAVAAIHWAAKGISRRGEPKAEALAAAIAENIEVKPGNIVLGHGTGAILHKIFVQWADPGRDHVLSYDFCRDIYRISAENHNLPFYCVPREDSFRIPLESLLENADENTRAIVVANPDVPSGFGCRVEELGVLTGFLDPSTIVIVDESHMDFAWPVDEYSALSLLGDVPNLVILRSFAVAYGMAGLRLSYAVMNTHMADILNERQDPFEISSLAQAAGLAALGDDEFYLSTLDTVLRGRKKLLETLPGMSCETVPSQANFVMFRPPRPAEIVARELAEKGVLVRHLNDLGLPDHLRVKVGTPEETDAFLKMLDWTLSK